MIGRRRPVIWALATLAVLERNGIEPQPYPAWGRSFVVVTDD